MAAGPSWYAHYPRDFLDGTAALSLAERGAYITFLDCLYAEGRPLRDDRGLAMLLRCSQSEWSAARKALLKAKKIHEVIFEGDRCLTNKRAERELVAYDALVAKRRRAAQDSLKARGLRPAKYLKLVED